MSSTMFSRTVKIDGTIIEVSCSPRTPYSEVLRRASEAIEAEEEAAREDMRRQSPEAANGYC